MDDSSHRCLACFLPHHPSSIPEDGILPIDPALPALKHSTFDTNLGASPPQTPTSGNHLETFSSPWRMQKDAGYASHPQRRHSMKH